MIAVGSCEYEVLACGDARDVHTGLGQQMGRTSTLRVGSLRTYTRTHTPAVVSEKTLETCDTRRYD